MTSKLMLPSMFLIPLLQPVAPAHVSERYRKKANRHHYENKVQHRCSLLTAARNGAPHFNRHERIAAFSFSPTSLSVSELKIWKSGPSRRRAGCAPFRY